MTIGAGGATKEGGAERLFDSRGANSGLADSTAVIAAVTDVQAGAGIDEKLGETAAE
jgi:hypothetical protein